MKRFILIALACFAVAGCKKALDKMEKDAYEPSGSGNATPNSGGGGSGGAVQAVRKAVTRTELQSALEQIRLFIDTASSTDGQMPSIETTYAALQREAPKHAKLVTDQHVVLNRASSRDDVWAYALLPQGNYIVATASGIETMAAVDLNNRLGR